MKDDPYDKRIKPSSPTDPSTNWLLSTGSSTSWTGALGSPFDSPSPIQNRQSMPSPSSHRTHANNAELTLATTAIARRRYPKALPLRGEDAILGLGSPEKVAAAEWVVQQVTPTEGHPRHRRLRPLSMEPFAPKVAVTCRRNPSPPPRSEPPTSTVEDHRHGHPHRGRHPASFPFGARPANHLRGSPEQADLAGWLVHEMPKHLIRRSPSDRHARILDGVVRSLCIGGANNSRKRPSPARSEHRRYSARLWVYPTARGHSAAGPIRYER